MDDVEKTKAWLKDAERIIRNSEEENSVLTGNISDVEVGQDNFITFVYTLQRPLADGIVARVAVGYVDLSPEHAKFMINSLGPVSRDTGGDFEYVSKILNPLGIYVPGDPFGGASVLMLTRTTREQIVMEYAAEKNLSRGD